MANIIDSLKNIGNKIADSLKNIGNSIKEFGNKVVKFFKDTWQSLKDKIKKTSNSKEESKEADNNE